ncbi:S100P-binding protein-like [Sardina pilchardus]|uniref:S100P-binding protein-like n=1 Tax=Sardina pilchardus TaxID=27697 RepID=UPI002E12099B
MMAGDSDHCAVFSSTFQRIDMMSRSSDPKDGQAVLDKISGSPEPIYDIPVVEIGRLSPIHCSFLAQDEGYETRSFTQEFPLTPIMSTPLKSQRQTPDLTAGADSVLSATKDYFGLCQGQRQTLDLTAGADAVLSVTKDASGLCKGDGLWESTLLDVQVKSKVVLPGSADVKDSSCEALPTFKPGRRVTPSASKRPRVFDRPEEWQQQKAVYVEAVSRHMKEKPKGGVINELLDLMNTVANEQHPWQHPSDLTTRNYTASGKGLMSLDDWIIKNGGSEPRFAR